MTNGKSHGHGKGLTIGIAVIGIAMMGMFAYALGILPGAPSASVGGGGGVLGGGTVDKSTWLSGGDFVSVTIKGVDAVTGGTLAEDTAMDTVLLNRISGDYFTTAASAGTSAGTHYLNTGDEIDGKANVCAYTEPKSGQSYIFSYVDLAQYNNNLVTYMKYIDVQSAAGLGDGNKEWTFCISTEGLIPYNEADGTTPPMQITIPFWNEAAMTDAAADDVTGVGEAAGTLSDLKWTLTGTKGDVTFVTKLQFKYNDTDLAEVNEGQSIVHFNGQTFTLSEFDDSLDSDETIFDYEFGSDISDAMPIIFPQNVGSATTELKLTTSWDMDNNDQFQVIYTLYLLDETGGSSTITDTVTVTEA